jgi:hypothetical protein
MVVAVLPTIPLLSFLVNFKTSGAIPFRCNRKVNKVKPKNSFLKKVAVGAGVVGASLGAFAQTDATVIATNAQTAFAVIAPITITIAGFYVILKIAKKVVH